MPNLSYFSLWRHIHRSADDVHDMMDDISEQQEISQEINDALAGGMGAQFDVDEVNMKKVWLPTKWPPYS